MKYLVVPADEHTWRSVFLDHPLMKISVEASREASARSGFAAVAA